MIHSIYYCSFVISDTVNLLFYPSLDSYEEISIKLLLWKFLISPTGVGRLQFSLFKERQWVVNIDIAYDKKISWNIFVDKINAVRWVFLFYANIILSDLFVSYYFEFIAVANFQMCLSLFWRKSPYKIFRKLQVKRQCGAHFLQIMNSALWIYFKEF